MSNEWPKFIDPEQAMRGSATSNVPAPQASNLEAIGEAMRQMKARMDEIDKSTTAEFAKWMQEQGFDPYSETAPALLVLPVSYQGQLMTWPPFVRFSPLLDAPVLMVDPSPGVL